MFIKYYSTYYNDTLFIKKKIKLISNFDFYNFSDLQTQLNLQNMDSCFIGIICSSYNTDTTTMVRK